MAQVKSNQSCACFRIRVHFFVLSCFSIRRSHLPISTSCEVFILVLALPYFFICCRRFTIALRYANFVHAPPPIHIWYRLRRPCRRPYLIGAQFCSFRTILPAPAILSEIHSLGHQIYLLPSLSSSSHLSRITFTCGIDQI